MIEDSGRFPKLLGAIDAYLPNPRAFRLCYRGLLNAYFSYDAETARSAGKHNWEQLALNIGLAKILARHCACRPITVHPELRDFALAQRGNPWLSLNKAKWSLVSDEARKMIAGWLKRILIKDFFSLLAADGSNDTRRLEFWERYVDSIDDMYFALGNTALWHRGTDYQNARNRMAGWLLNLHSAGPPITTHS